MQSTNRPIFWHRHKNGSTTQKALRSTCSKPIIIRGAVFSENPFFIITHDKMQKQLSFVSLEQLFSGGKGLQNSLGFYSCGTQFRCSQTTSIIVKHDKSTFKKYANSRNVDTDLHQAIFKLCRLALPLLFGHHDQNHHFWILVTNTPNLKLMKHIYHKL